MLISIDPNDDRPIYLQIVDEVRRGIVIGTASAETPLPSVRQLAAELRINPNTVGQAYRELERQGLAYARRGQGTFVSPRATESADDERSQLARTLARRIMAQAHRNGLSIDELMTALREEESGKAGNHE